MIQVEFWQLVSGAFALSCVVIGGFWAFTKIIVGQFTARLDEKFKAQDTVREASKEEWNKKFESLEAAAKKTDQEVMQLKIELPKMYVQREDWIRFATTIESKIDKVYKLLWKMRGGNDE